ncbi:hypothetical protein V1514DRAFT_337749 [Lipomyces japonicus]|uniref:uncharacterized protein n=1 Tax=Lipomyces japonicus TaxID=56871 RepID=UPI0034CE99F9
MLRAFAPVPVVDLSSKERISAIFATRGKLFLGFSTGAVKVFEDQFLETVQDDPTPTPTQQAQLIASIDNVSKKPIEQIGVLEEANVLVILSADYVFLYDLSTLKLQERLHRTKGAVVFATSSELEFSQPHAFLNAQNKPSRQQILANVSRLAIVVKRKLHCYEWQGVELIGSREISITDRPRSINFIKPDKVLCGSVVDYFIVNISSSTVSQAFAAGKPVGPIDGALAGVAANIGDIANSASRRNGLALATRLQSDNLILLVNEFSSVLLSPDTDSFVKRSNKPRIQFRDVPSRLAYSYPYILSLTANMKRLEIRSPSTFSLLQSINFPSLSFITEGNHPYVATARQVWKLRLFPFNGQIQTLVEKNHLEEAIKLLEVLDDTYISNRTETLRELKMKKAEELFAKGKFSRSMTIFCTVSAPPKRVLSLFPSQVSGIVHDEDNNVNNKDITTKPPDIKNDDTSKQKPADDNASLTDSLKENQQKQDLEVFNRFLRPSGNVQDNSSSPARSSTTGAETMSLTDSFANFLSFGKSSKGPSSEVDTSSIFSRPDDLQGKSLQKSVRCLLIYLIDARRKLARLLSVEAGQVTKEDFDLVNDDGTNIAAFGNDLTYEAEVVDTALLRSYMLVNPALVGPLVRLPNQCNANVVQEQLLQNNKYLDLIDFYFTKKLHEKSLKLLKRLGEENTVIEFSGPEPTVKYIKRLGQNDLELIFEYAQWPISCDEKYAEQIFMASTEESESLARNVVFAYLNSISRVLTIKYLEYVILVLKDPSPEFHNELAAAYLEYIKSNAHLYSNDDSNIQITLEKLIRLLHESKQYKPEKIIGLVPRDLSLFWEAKAILFSRMGEHRRALEIYVFSMKDYNKAQEYCMDVYDTDLPNSKSVFHTLLELYLKPYSFKKLGSTSGKLLPTTTTTTIQLSNSPQSIDASFSKDEFTPSDISTSPRIESFYDKPTMNLDAALDLLSNHGSRVSAIDALELLPDQIKMNVLGPFLESHIREAHATVERDRIYAALLKADLVRTQQALITLKSNSISISDTRVCPVCVKRIGNSVISVMPNKVVVHYGCAKAYKDKYYAKVGEALKEA